MVSSTNKIIKCPDCNNPMATLTDKDNLFKCFKCNIINLNGEIIRGVLC